MNALQVSRPKTRSVLAGIEPDDGKVVTVKKLSEGALLFPGGDLKDLTLLRDASAVTRVFKRHEERLGFKIRFHDLRASHLTLLLDKGEPVHVVAARAGHDPVVLSRNYVKSTKKADAKVAEATKSQRG
jgi:integrase